MAYYAYRKIRAYQARIAAEEKAQAQEQHQEQDQVFVRQEAAVPASSDSSAPSTVNHSLASPSIKNKLKPKPQPQRCPQCKEEKSRARKCRWKLLLCLTPAFFVASLDLTIIATALPRIASHYDKFNQLNWIVTSFTLTSTAFIPVFGQLADTFGRHATLQAAVALLIIGSVLCAAAPDWAVLLLGRALQGVGTAGIQNVVMIVLADIVSLKEQAINTSIFQLLNGIGYGKLLRGRSHLISMLTSDSPAVGPLIGGYLTNANWRYCFVLCAGVSVISSVCILLLRKDVKPGKVSVSHPAAGQSRLQALGSGLSTLDYGGIALFILGVGLIILGTAWGGSTYPWSSAAVLSSLIIGSLLFIFFLAYETLLSNPTSLLTRSLPHGTVPMIPSTLFLSKDVSLVSFISFSTGAALYSVFYFIGIYFTLVEAYAASHAGTQLLYYVPGIGIGVYAAIFICNAYPRQTFPPLLLGTIVETAGISALAYAVKARNATLVNVMMGVAGAGTGLRFMPSSLHLAGMFRDQLAPVFSILRFATPFGGTLALTIMGSVFQNQMSDYFGSSAVRATNGTGSSNAGNGTVIDLHNQASLESINLLPLAQQDAIRAQCATATMWAFISIVPILGLSFLASLFLGNVWISKKKVGRSDGLGEKEEEGKGERVRSGDGDRNQSGRDDGLCKNHAAVVHGGETITATEEEQRNEVEYLSQVYLLAVMRGDVKRLKKKGASAAGVVFGQAACGKGTTDLENK